MAPVFDVLVLIRWVHFGALFALFGGVMFPAYAPGEAIADVLASWRFHRRYQTIAAAVALATGALWLVATIVNTTGLEGLCDPDTLHAFFFETLFGPIEATRMVLLVVLALFAVVPMPERPRVAALAVASALVLVSQAWLGHAAEDGATLSGAAMIAAYAAHVLAGAAWLGGLPPLFVRIVELRQRPGPAAPLLRLLSRYSLMATLAVGLVLASGMANAAFRVRGRFGAMLWTPYGDVLLAKLALVGLMLGFATYNRLIAMPRLRRLGDGGSTTISSLAISVAIEIALGLAVLAAAAVLGITPPPR